MKILITGIAGLIGRHTATALSRTGHEVLGLDIKSLPGGVPAVEHHVCDLRNSDAVIRVMQTIAPDAVIHLAAHADIYGGNSLASFSSNVDGVRHLIEAIKATPSVRRSIFTSSQLVCRMGYVPARMDDYCPTTTYGESKVETERIVRSMDGGGREWIIVRPTTVWGPHMVPHYQRMLELIRRGYYFHCGPGRLSKSYAYVENIAHQYGRLLDAPADRIMRRTLYLADYDPISLRDYCDALAAGLKAPRIPTYPLPLVRGLAKAGDLLNTLGWKRFPFNSFRLNNILTEYVFDLQETAEICGPLPCTWEEGVEATCRWYLSLKEHS